jgi:hypothetical protein
MRSRQMLIKLGGLHLPPLEAGCPDLTLLTPEEQDRAWELAKKGNNTLEGLERRGDGRGDWAETSLCNAATLLQLLFQRAGSDAPASARGQLATGMTAGERVYQLGDGWIFAQAPRDITAELGQPQSRGGACLVRTAEHPRGAGADL